MKIKVNHIEVEAPTGLDKLLREEYSNVNKLSVVVNDKEVLQHVVEYNRYGACAAVDMIITSLVAKFDDLPEQSATINTDGNEWMLLNVMVPNEHAQKATEVIRGILS